MFKNSLWILIEMLLKDSEIKSLIDDVKSDILKNYKKWGPNKINPLYYNCILASHSALNNEKLKSKYPAAKLSIGYISECDEQIDMRKDKIREFLTYKYLSRGTEVPDYHAWVDLGQGIILDLTYHINECGAHSTDYTYVHDKLYKLKDVNYIEVLSGKSAMTFYEKLRESIEKSGNFESKHYYSDKFKIGKSNDGLVAINGKSKLVVFNLGNNKFYQGQFLKLEDRKGQQSSPLVKVANFKEIDIDKAISCRRIKRSTRFLLFLRKFTHCQKKVLAIILEKLKK
ncbi:hypothetical protein ACP6IB_27055 [Vibrio harveyi]|uniref:hypothetical protein n=1 Tax=Vibrio harveyi TaxID=669 RepID=UPI003CF10C8F